MKRPLIEKLEFDRIRSLSVPEALQFLLLADMIRLNTLTAVKIAGSGHLGSSFSSADLVAYIYFKTLGLSSETLKDPHRNIFFSSKGHDVPGQYAALYALGIISLEQFLRLRRFGGLDGHPDVHVPGIETNSGSLGMGISKGKGFAWAKNYLNLGGHVYVITGDGEFQEGQNYEALMSAVAQDIRNITVIMDHNKVQSDKYVDEIVSLGPLKERLSSFGWFTISIDGNDFHDIDYALRLSRSHYRLFVIAHTIKGKGVSFMEHPQAMLAHKGLYPYHAGAPDEESYQKGVEEIIHRIHNYCGYLGIEPVQMIEAEEVNPQQPKVYNALGEPVSQASVLNQSLKTQAEYVVNAFGDALVELGAEHKHLVVLDADLSSDCRLRKFENTFPERFIECGIAEQDMVSMAGGLARMGLLPVVNSFASFLASRANEQIYNNTSEKTHIIYAFHYGGLIPAGPGKSHQSLRDISLVAALPDCTIVQPANPHETRQALRYFVEMATGCCVLRMNIGPSPSVIHLPENYRFELGRGSVLRQGNDAALVAYGPVMLHEALGAADLLEEKGIQLMVINMPWLNRLDVEWLEKTLKGITQVFIIEDHAPMGGLGQFWLYRLYAADQFADYRIHIWGVEGWPACGTPAEALAYHQLDAASLSFRIAKALTHHLHVHPVETL